MRSEEQMSPEDFTTHYLAKHIVALKCELPSNDDEIRRMIASGFCVRVDENWYLVTAGHVLEEIAIGMSEPDPSKRPRNFELVDGLGYGKKHLQPIPIPYRAPEFCVNSEFGPDFAAIKLEHLEVENLKKNNVEPITEEHIQFCENEEFDFLGLVGLPTESMEFSKAGSRISVHYCRLELLNDVPSAFRKYTCKKTVARLLDDKPDDIDGMSGGFVIGWKELPQVNYCFLAIQSGWLSESRIICAFDLSGIVGHIRSIGAC